MHPSVSRAIAAPLYKKVMKKLRQKDRDLFEQVEGQMEKIVREPELGKPLRHDLKNHRRLHVGSSVILYEFHAGVLNFLDFDHHDKI